LRVHPRLADEILRAQPDNGPAIEAVGQAGDDHHGAARRIGPAQCRQHLRRVAVGQMVIQQDAIGRACLVLQAGAKPILAPVGFGELVAPIRTRQQQPLHRQAVFRAVVDDQHTDRVIIHCELGQA
jgi:hypothetical protein